MIWLDFMLPGPTSKLEFSESWLNLLEFDPTTII